MEEEETITPVLSASPLTLAALCLQLPKTELHAHLHGSIRPSTLSELFSAVEKSTVPSSSSSPSLPVTIMKPSIPPAKYDGAMHIIQHILPLNHRSLSDCFKIFDVIHFTVNTAAAVGRITKEMIEDCIHDNIKYVEIRTTPRSIADPDNLHTASPTTRYINLPPGAWYITPDSSSSSSSSCSSSVPVQFSNESIRSIDCGYDIDSGLNHYVETVIHTISQYYTEASLTSDSSSSPIIIRLLFSLNRTSSLTVLEKIIQLTLVWSRVRLPWLISSSSTTVPFPPSHQLVVGMDISGDPTRGDLSPILNLLDKYLGKEIYDSTTHTFLSKRTLPVTVHAGEIMNIKETETVLKWLPNRLGHMCVLNSVLVNNLLCTLPNSYPSKDTSSLPSSFVTAPHTFLNLPFPIPIELCPTSNALTLNLPSLHHHPTLSPWLENNYPISIATDDSGVFNVTLSSEYQEVCETYKLKAEQLITLAEQGFRYSFCEPKVQTWLIQQLRPEFLRLQTMYSGGGSKDTIE